MRKSNDSMSQVLSKFLGSSSSTGGMTVTAVSKTCVSRGFAWRKEEQEERRQLARGRGED